MRVALIAIGLASAGAAAAVPLEIGKTYEGGTVIEAAAYGFDFIVPEGWSGLLPPGGTFFAMTPDNRSFVFATAEPGAAQEALGALLEPLPLGNGARLQPIGAPRREGDRFVVGYDVLGAKEPYGGEGHALVSQQGVVVGLIGVAPQADIEQLQAVLAELAKGVRFTGPPAPDRAAAKGKDG
jgi:hypothetical protein